MFRTLYNYVSDVKSKVGSRYHTLYTSKLVDGTIQLVASGQEDIYNYIQSHKDSVNINNILAKFANGDSSVLSRRQGMFGDFTKVPNSFADALNSVILGRQYFESLSLEDRQKFGNSFETFLTALDNPEVFKTFFETGAIQSVVKPAESASDNNGSAVVNEGGVKVES